MTRVASRLAFVFSTRGLQWKGMGRDLFAASQTFRNVVATCEPIVRRRLGWSLADEFQRGDDEYRLHDDECLEPALTALQIGLTAIWREHGIELDGVVGLSGGEFAAAAAAGALSVEDAITVSCAVALAMRRGLGRGAMLTLGAGEVETQALLRELPPTIVVAASLASNTTVLAGDRASIAEALLELSARGLPVKLQPFGFGFHSPLVDGWKEVLAETLAEIQARPLAVHTYSAAVGGVLADDAKLDAMHWWHVCRDRVRYAEAIDDAIEAGFDAFVEIGPHPMLLGGIELAAATAGRRVTTIASLERDQPVEILLNRSLRALHALGFGEGRHQLT